MEYWSDGVLGRTEKFRILRFQNPMSQNTYRRMLTLMMTPMANIMDARAEPP